MAISATEPGKYVFGRNGRSPDLKALPESFQDYLTSVRRYLHMRPETGYKELETSRFVRQRLKENDLSVVGPLAKTGMYVDIRGRHEGPIVAYRCDMDALPIQDAKDVPYASRHAGVAHLCGHDAHMTVGLGVALLLNELRDDLHGTVRILFQPNEESTPSGSILMIRDGVLDGVEAVYCIHVDPTLDTGKFGLITGAITASSDRFQVRVHTRTTGHSARPHQTRDTVWIAVQLLNQFYQLSGRVTDSRATSLITACMFSASEAHNVIPCEVSLEGTLRTLDRESRSILLRYMRRTARQLATLHDVGIDIRFIDRIPSILNDARLVDNVRRTVTEIFGDDAIFDIPVPSMGADDFAHYLDHVPGMLLRVGTRSDQHTAHPLHDAHFDVDESFLKPTVQLVTTALINHLQGCIMD